MVVMSRLISPLMRSLSKAHIGEVEVNVAITDRNSGWARAECRCADMKEIGIAGVRDGDHHFMTGDMAAASIARKAIFKSSANVDPSFALSLDVGVISFQRRDMQSIFLY